MRYLTCGVLHNYKKRDMRMKTDVLIAGSGCSALYAAYNLPRDKQILLITKRDLETNDSFLAQGGKMTRFQ